MNGPEPLSYFTIILLGDGMNSLQGRGVIAFFLFSISQQTLPAVSAVPVRQPSLRNRSVQSADLVAQPVDTRPPTDYKTAGDQVSASFSWRLNFVKHRSKEPWILSLSRLIDNRQFIGMMAFRPSIQR